MDIKDFAVLSNEEIKSLKKNAEIDVEANWEINKNILIEREFEFNTELNQTFSLKNSEPTTNYRSHQILNEPILAISGAETIERKFIENNNQLVEGIFGNLKDRLDGIDLLNDSKGKISNPKVKFCIDSAINNCLTVNALGAHNYNNTNGSIFVSPFHNYSIDSGKINLNSNSSTFVRSPLIENVSQNYVTTANNSHSTISDLQLKQSKTDVTITDSSVVSSVNATLVATENINQTGNNVSSVAVSTHNTTSKNVSVMAQDSIVSYSQKDLRTVAGNKHSTQSSSVEILATDGAKTDIPSAAAGSVNKNPGNATFTIAALNNGENTYTIGSSKGLYSGSTGFNYSLSNKGTLIKSDRSTVISSNSTASISGTRNSVVGKTGRKTFIGSISFELPEFSLPIAKTIPAFPAIPKINVDALNNCLPDRYKQQRENKTKNQTPVITENSDIEPTYTTQNKIEEPVFNPKSDRHFPSSTTAEVNNEAKNINALTRSNIYFTPSKTPEEDLNSLLPQSTNNNHQHQLNKTILNFSIEDFQKEKFIIDLDLSSDEQIQLLDRIKYFVINIVPRYIKYSVEDLLTNAKLLTESERNKIDLLLEYTNRDEINKSLIKFIQDRFVLIGIGHLNNNYVNNLISYEDAVQIESNDKNIVEELDRILKQTNFSDTDSVIKNVEAIGKTIVYSESDKDIENQLLEYGYEKSAPLVIENLGLDTNPEELKQLGIEFYDFLNNRNSLVSSEQVSDYIDRVLKIVLKDSQYQKLENIRDLTSAVKEIVKETKSVFQEAKQSGLAGFPRELLLQEEEINPEQITDLFNTILDTGNRFVNLPFYNTAKKVIQLASSIHKSVDEISKSVKNKDYKNILFGSADLLQLVGVLNNSHLELIQKSYDTVIQGIETYNSIKDVVNTIEKIPAALKYFDEYNIPQLEQLAIVIGCLDLINKLQDAFNEGKNLYERIKDLIAKDQNFDKSTNNNALLNNLEVEYEQDLEKVYKRLLPTNFSSGITNNSLIQKRSTIQQLELLPKMYQIANTLNSLSKNDLDLLQNKLVSQDSKYIDKIESDLSFKFKPTDREKLIIKKEESAFYTEIPIVSCNLNSTKTLLDAALDIEKIEAEYIYFKLSYPNRKRKYPNREDLLQIYVTEFKLRDGSIANIYSDSYQYTPAVYSFTILDFNRETNYGVARLNFLQTNLILQKDNGVLLEFNSNAWNKNIFPIIKDIYLI